MEGGDVMFAATFCYFTGEIQVHPAIRIEIECAMIAEVPDREDGQHILSFC